MKNNEFLELKKTAFRELMLEAKQAKNRSLCFKLKKEYKKLFSNLDGGAKSE